MRSVVLATATLAAVPRLLPAQAAPDASAQAAQKELEQYASVLNSRTATAAQRDQVAQRLVSRSTRDADDLLLFVLRNGVRESQISVTRALGADPTPNPDFVEPLANLLGDRELTGPSAQALALFRTNERARQRLGAFVVNTSELVSLRTAAIRAMGKLVDKSAARLLVDLLNDRNGLVRVAAMDALIEITGETRFGYDTQQWLNWWRGSEGLDELEWSRRLLNLNVDRANVLQSRLQTMRLQTVRFIREEYQDTRVPQADRTKRLLSYLRADSEDMRFAAAQMVDQVTGLLPVTAEILEAMRGMVADSSADVRGKVAEVLGKVNDPRAVDALLSQVAQEQDPDVLQKIIEALGPSPDLRTLDPILANLKNPAVVVAQRAADAIRVKADILRKPENAALAEKVAGELIQRMGNTSGPAMVGFRESLASAMARLGHPSCLQVFYTLLGDEALNVRRSALQGLSRIGNPAAANRIMTVFQNDPDRGVRLDAARALRSTATSEHIDIMLRRLFTEPDESVREDLWRILAVSDDSGPALFQRGTIEELLRWAEQLRRMGQRGGLVELTRRAAMLRIAEKKLLEPPEAQRDVAALASVRQSLGETLLSLVSLEKDDAAVARAEEAAQMIQAALSYGIGHGAAPGAIDLLIQQQAEAMLRARKYADAARFMTEAIQAHRINPNILWSNKIKREIERLRLANEYKGADLLIRELKSVPLDTLSRQGLDNLEREVQQRLNTGGLMWGRPGRIAGSDAGEFRGPAA